MSGKIVSGGDCYDNIPSTRCWTNPEFKGNIIDGENALRTKKCRSGRWSVACQHVGYKADENPTSLLNCCIDKITEQSRKYNRNTPYPYGLILNSTSRTCNPDWTPASQKCNEPLTKYCSGSAKLFTNPVCKQWCDSNKDKCVEAKKNYCNTPSKLRNDLNCKSFCTDNDCDQSVQKLCVGENLNTPDCVKYCFGTAIGQYKYDCKDAVYEYCKVPANQSKPMCQCYLPQSFYAEQYNDFLQTIPIKARDAVKQITTMPRCNYQPCTGVKDRYPLRENQAQCPNQVLCLQDIDLTGAKLDQSSVQAQQKCGIEFTCGAENPCQDGYYCKDGVCTGGTADDIQPVDIKSPPPPTQPDEPTTPAVEPAKTKLPINKNTLIIIGVIVAVLILLFIILVIALMSRGRKRQFQQLPY